jgi:ADP-ribose pyrophosphatase YjhB (NUDIX family)
LFSPKEYRASWGEENGTCPGGRVQYKETLEATLKRIAYTKTSLKIKLFYPSLKESLVGIYDNPERDPREHVISIAFLCKITEGKTKPGTKVEAVNSFSEAETKNLEIAFDHRKTVEEAFSILKKNGSITKDEHLNATQI